MMRDWLNRLWNRLSGWDRMARAFEADYPGRCAYCSYHWYGITSCQIHPDQQVPAHRCRDARHLP
jgi:hypothetical protein